MADLARAESQRVSSWAAGGAVFAATMMVMIGAFEAISGLVALVDDEFFVVTQNYLFKFDVTTWGWIHLILGLLLVATGVGLFARQSWAGLAAIVLAVLSAVANFFFIPYYPFWSLVVIGLNIWVIWSLTRPGVLEA